MKNVIVTDTENNKKISYRDYDCSIMVYGLTKKQISIISKNIPSNLKTVITKADCYLDIFVLPIAEFYIVDSKKIKTEDMENFNECYVETFYKNTTYFMSKEKRLKKHHKFFKDEKDFEKNIAYVILGFISEHKKRAAFSEQIANVLYVLKRILAKPYITTKKIAKELELSERSVQRYIETLNIAGEEIFYDTKKHGWYLFDGESYLLKTNVKKTISV